MIVLALTVFVTLILVLFFIFLFVVQIAAGKSLPDQDALLPLSEETSTPPAKGAL